MLKELKPFLIATLIIASLFFGVSSALAAPDFRQEQGLVPVTDSKFYLGTTTPSLKAWLRVIADSFYDTDASDGCATWSSNVLTSTGSACGSGGGGAFAWTVQSWGVSTSTTIGFLNGFISTASSTFTGGFFANAGTTTNATSTNLSISGNLDVDNLTSALILTGSGGDFAEYAGTTCTNQFVRVLSVLGVATCATVGTADVAGLDISDDTNLSATWPVVISGDAVTWDGLATTSNPTAGNLFYSNGTRGLVPVATSSVTINSPLTSAGTAGAVVGGSGWTLDLDETASYTWTGTHIFNNITRSTTTQATSTNFFGGIFNANTLRVGQTATTSIESDGDLQVTGSTTLQNFTATNSTSSSATTTNFHISGNLNFNNVSGSTWAGFCTTITGGAGLCDGDDATGGASIGKTWELVSNGDFLFATSSPLKSVGVGASTTASLNKLALFQVNATSTTGHLIVASSTTGFTGNYLRFTDATGARIFSVESDGDLVTTGSTTLNRFTGTHSTTTNATTTNFAVSNLTSALILSGADGSFGEYLGVTCTNQALTVLSAVGAGTCSSINNDYWSGTGLSVANGGTGLSSFGGVDTVLFTTAADTLVSDSTFTYVNSRDNHGVGTSTPRWALQIASSTGPQLTLSDPSVLTNNHWSFRNAGGNLYLATSSPSTYATTSSNSVSILPSTTGSAGLLIGTSTAGSTGLSVVGTVFMHTITTASGVPSSICQNATTKEITVNAALTCTVSDEEQKSQMRKLDLDALSLIEQIDPISFSYNADPGRMRYGFGAQSLQRVDPHLADAYGEDGIARSIDLSALVALNTKAIQELNEKIGGGEERKKNRTDLLQWGIIILLGLWVLRLELKK